MVHADFLGQRTPRKIVLLTIGFETVTDLHSLTRLWRWFILSTTNEDLPLVQVTAAAEAQPWATPQVLHPEMPKRRMELEG